ncbi:MAG: DgaE family pyridoxal phosphate-dependent ammonia lyase [Bulleidia sp.]|nr:DgaE family pyridoxal phosphate-dependent ammonia lyase [Bulleidia sp.]
MNNIYMKYGLDPVINADGRMTALGVSTISDEVAEVMKEAAQNYVVIDDLYKVVGAQLAKVLNVPDVCPTESASAGIALSVAALICGNDIGKVKTFYQTVAKTEKREIVLLKGQNVDYGAPIQVIIELGGGKVVEAGFANGSTAADVENAINENTLAVFFVKSHHCVQKNMLSPEEVIAVAKKHNLPVILDASAEEDLFKYAKMGADFVCYSGAKAISGCTSGFVECSSEEYADAMRLQYKGIGRVMKIGKENCMGLLSAVTTYVANNGYKAPVTTEDLEKFNERIAEIPGLSADIIQDEAGRAIFRSRIKVDARTYGVDAVELNKLLRKESPKIYLRDHMARQGSLAVDPRPLPSTKDLDEIYEVLKRIHEAHA